jgi:HTH-type transcriptional regulator / antitoxin HigA
MTMDIRPLHTDEDHAWALREIEGLWSRAQPGTPDGDRFEVLATLVESYERRHAPIEPADPIEAIRFRMEQESLTAQDLLGVFKTRARVSEVLGKRRRLSLAMIRKLHEQLSIPVESLVAEYPLRRKRGPKPRRSTARSSKLAKGRTSASNSRRRSR